jgi:hypothetical protein
MNESTTLVPVGDSPQYDSRFKFCGACGHEYEEWLEIDGYNRETGAAIENPYYGCKYAVLAFEIRGSSRLEHESWRVLDGIKW